MKNIIRERAKNLRKLLHSGEKDLKIIKNLMDTCEYQESKNLLIYYPLKYEINTLKCLKDNTKKFYLPRVNGSELLICEYKENELKKGSFNIQEPSNEPVKDLSVIDTVIVPACAVDIKGYRLGYGKGFYDNFLKKVNCKKIVLIYEDLIFPSVYPEKHDVKCDIAVNEKYILNFR